MSLLNSPVSALLHVQDTAANEAQDDRQMYAVDAIVDSIESQSDSLPRTLTPPATMPQEIGTPSQTSAP